MDRGTENVVIEDIQTSFRWNDNDDLSGEKSVIYGASHSNQRVERWWGSLRSGGGGFWIDSFKDMVDTGIFTTGNWAHIECVRLCYVDLLQNELNQIMIDWNQHRIRASRQGDVLGGKPDLLYFTPQIHGAEDMKIPVSLNDLSAVWAMNALLMPESSTPVRRNIQRMVNNSGRTLPADIHEAKNLLVWLINQLHL